MASEVSYEGFPYDIVDDNVERNFKLGNFVPVINGRFVLMLNKGSFRESTGPKYGILGGTAKIHDENIFKDISGFDSLRYFEKPSKPGEKKRKDTDPEVNIMTSSFSQIGKLKSLIRDKKRELSAVIEFDPKREIIEELSKERIPGYQKKPILSVSEASRISFTHIGDIDYGNKEDKGNTNTHYYRSIFQGFCDREIFRKLQSHSSRKRKSKTPPVIYFPTQEEMEKGVTDSGIRISETAMTLYKNLKDRRIIYSY